MNILCLTQIGHVKGTYELLNSIGNLSYCPGISKEQVQEEIEEKIDILEWLIKEEGDASLLELQSIKDFIDTLEEDQNYFLFVSGNLQNLDSFF
mgnify:CR=1 FL=1